MPPSADDYHHLSPTLLYGIALLLWSSHVWISGVVRLVSKVCGCGYPSSAQIRHLPVNMRIRRVPSIACAGASRSLRVRCAPRGSHPLRLGKLLGRLLLDQLLLEWLFGEAQFLSLLTEALDPFSSRDQVVPSCLCLNG